MQSLLTRASIKMLKNTSFMHTSEFRKILHKRAGQVYGQLFHIVRICFYDGHFSMKQAKILDKNKDSCTYLHANYSEKKCNYSFRLYMNAIQHGPDRRLPHSQILQLQLMYSEGCLVRVFYRVPYSIDVIKRITC